MWSGRSGGGDLLAFWSWSYRRMLVVEAIGLHTIPAATDDLEAPDQDVKAQNLCLEKIARQSCIDSIDFKHEDGWAYLVDKPCGPRIIHKPRKLYNIPCDFLWAPRVDISEIDMKKMEGGFGRAVWRGRDVDVHIGFDDGELRYVERETRALKAVRAMDITYGVVAHIFRGEKLVGLMRESSRMSRSLRAADRAAVFAAFALLESAFIIHTFIFNVQSIVMDERGKVRMLYIDALKFYGQDERESLERDAQIYHWAPLLELFDIFTQYGDGPLGWPSYFWYPSSTVLASTPSPGSFMLITLKLTGGVDVCTQPDEEKKRRRHKGGSKASLEVRVARSKGHTLAPVKAARSIDHYRDSPAKLGPSRGRSVDLRVVLAPTAEDERVDGGGFIVEEDECLDRGFIVKEEERSQSRGAIVTL